MASGRRQAEEILLNRVFKKLAVNRNIQIFGFMAQNHCNYFNEFKVGF